MKKVKLPISTADKYIPHIYVKGEQELNSQWGLVVEFHMNSNGYFNQVDEYKICYDPYGDGWSNYYHQPCSYRGGYTLSELKRLLKREGFASVWDNSDDATGEAVCLIKR